VPEIIEAEPTWRRKRGEEVPIPTFPFAPTLIRLLPEPSAIIMLLERPAERPTTFAPRIVLFTPVTIPRPVLYPTAVLFPVLVAVLRFESALKPSAILFEPATFKNNAPLPIGY